MTQEELLKKLQAELNKLSPDKIDQIKQQVNKDLEKKWKPRETQISAYLSPADELFYGGIAGAGKAISIVRTFVYTVMGLTRYSELKVGDSVIGSNGEFTKVIAISDIMYDRPCFSVKFDDGEDVVADSDHIWPIYWNKTDFLLVRTSDIKRNYLLRWVKVPYVKNKDGEFVKIKSIDNVDSEPVMCIQVKAEDGIFLIGERPKQTHNSDLLLGLAMTQHNRSLIIRKNTTEVGDIVKRFKEINIDNFNEEWHWKHIGNGGEGSRLRNGQLDIVEISGCETPADMHKFRGRKHDLKAFDEVSEINEEVYRFINGWNRSSDPKQRCRIVCASNPPVNTSGEWIIKRWAAWLDPSAGKLAKYGELKWYSMIDGKEEEFPDGSEFEHGGYKLKPQSRTFIPGQMLQLLKDGGYQSRLAILPEPYRTAYLTGNFAAARKDEENQVIPSAWVRMAQERWCDRWLNKGELMRAGYDVASSKNPGGDRACLAKYYENKIIGPLVTVPGTDTPDGKSACKLMLREGINSQVIVNVDAIGIGAAAHEVSEMMGLNVRALVVSNSTNWKDDKIPKMKFPNIRSAMWWNLRIMLDPERGTPQDRLALPPDPAVMSDLTAPLYDLTSGGIRVEPKDKIRERIGRSTDVGDAICMSLWMGSRGLIVFAN